MNKAYREGYDRIVWKPVTEVRKEPVPSKRSSFPCPRVFSDTMPALEHVDGKFYDSKSQFRAVTKAHGYTEMGNDPARLRPKPKPLPDREGIKKSIKNALQKHGLD